MNKRTIKSLVLSCFRRYPVPMTAWQVGKIISRNPASVSSRLCEMRTDGKIICFLDNKKRLLYMLPSIDRTIHLAYAGTKMPIFYKGPQDSEWQQGLVDKINCEFEST